MQPQRIAYVVDITTPGGMFVARDFQIRDGDTIYVTEAPFVVWDKIIASTLGSLNAANSVAASSNIITN